MQKIIVSDFDGVIGDSLPVGLKILKEMVDLFDKSKPITSFGDYYRFFGKKTELEKISDKDIDTLKELYRLLHRHRYSEISIFNDVLDVYSSLFQKPLIVSSAYANTIQRVLGTRVEIFDKILGYESGKKKELLENLKKEYNFIYITDTYRDIITCRSVAVPVIATTWGYDSIEKLSSENPDYLANNAQELNDLLSKLEFKS